MGKRKPTNGILYLSTFPPRECGIATFTRDLVEAIRRQFNPGVKPQVLAINSDLTDIYNYERSVTHQINALNIEDYIIAARKINEDEEIKLVHVQHEFGIFGGYWGNHVIPFFQVIEKPVIVTFHTVLPNPKRNIRHIVQFILQHAKAVIVMNAYSKQILQEEYGAEESLVYVVPHGIPQVEFSDGREEKQRFGLEGKTVLSTFGLLSRSKGVEYALRALPAIVKHYPNVLYLIIGVTHPMVRKKEGESYRNFLHHEVQRLGLKNHVKFYNKYLSLEEVISYLKATDIYVSPTVDREQSVSGTLSYALGCGRPVVSTDSLYAKSIVNTARGRLVKPKSSTALKHALLELLKDPKALNDMGKNAYAETRHMVWPNIALAHFQIYQKSAQLAEEQKLPPITLKHLATLTDAFGIIQFAKHTKPDRRYGYSLDDNARAMIVTAMAWSHSRDEHILGLLQIYLKFVKFVQKENGKFANFVTSKKIIKHPDPSDDDVQGRIVWALGFLGAQDTLPASIKKQADAMFQKALPKIPDIKSPRAIAFAMLGLFYYSQAHGRPRVKNLLRRLADSQVQRFSAASSKDWPWFEESFTYSNSKLPESLFYAYLATGNAAYLEVAEQSLQFLLRVTFEKEYFSPIGQNGWYIKDGKRAYFDQQPEDASSTVQTLLVAYQATKKKIYEKRALEAFQWFLGKNHLRQMVYDETTGGCHDGVGQNTLNLNQGAESTISYLLARLALEDLQHENH